MPANENSRFQGRVTVGANVLLMIAAILFLVESVFENGEHDGNVASSLNLLGVAWVLRGIAAILNVSVSQLFSAANVTPENAAGLRNGALEVAAGSSALSASLWMDRFLVHAGAPLAASVASTLFPVGALSFAFAHELQRRGDNTARVPALLGGGSALFNVGSTTFVIVNVLGATAENANRRAAALYIAGASGFAVGSAVFAVFAAHGLLLRYREAWQRQEAERGPLLGSTNSSSSLTRGGINGDAPPPSSPSLG